jgi:hypothetical protein
MIIDPATLEYDKDGYPVFHAQQESEEYREAADKLSMTERTELAFRMSAVVIGRIRQQVVDENPGLSKREIMIRTSERMYADDRGALKLLQQMREHYANQPDE